MRILSMLAITLMLAVVPLQAETLQQSVDQALSVIKRFKELPEKSIPEEVIRDAKGLAVLTVVKAGFIFSARGGQGVVLARTPTGWSGPSAVGTGGVGFGLQIGVQATEFVIVLNTPAAVEAFAQGGNVELGADLSVAAGPVGRHVAGGVMPTAAVYTYSQSQGIFAGVSLEGTVIITKKERNAEYYGRPVEASDILKGRVPPPAGALPLIKELKDSSAGALPPVRVIPATGARTPAR
ncbi:MAG: YSC84-related protein [Verrucomicrobiia bacterium]